MKNDWLKITREHVVEAIEYFEENHEHYPPAKNTFLIYKEKKYPAKHIRWLAYQKALGNEITKSEFSGGQETVDFFRKLGFESQYSPDNPNTDLITDDGIDTVLIGKSPDEKSGKELTGRNRRALKIGLYLQGDNDRNERSFNRKIRKASKYGLDLLVFPETCFTPYSSDFERISLENDVQTSRMLARAMGISRELGCAVIISAEEKTKIIYSIYANAYAEDEETKEQLYYKHTATENSPLGNPKYKDMIDEIFNPIVLKGNRIGITICYDCTHPAISRAWGKQHVDILVNSTGGNVVDTKWNRYQKVRALENQCFTLCTMGHSRSEKSGSYTYGFTPNGMRLIGKPIYPINTEEDSINNIYVYDTSVENDRVEDDITLNQSESRSKIEHWKLMSDDLDKLIYSSIELSEGLYLKSIDKNNLIICKIDGKDIMKPEVVLRAMYNENLKKYKNKKYLILNTWEHYDSKHYNTVLSDVLKVRTVENFCAVLYKSPQKTMCFQSGKNKNVQVVMRVDNGYGLDFKRMSGPDSIWKNKHLMKADWRIGYIHLIHTF